MERKNKMMKGASEEILNRFLKEFWALEEKLICVHNELLEALEELRKYTTEEAKLEEWSFFDTSGVGLGRRALRSEGGAGLAGVTGR